MMTGEDSFLIARILHVIGVVLWIGGVAFIATVLLPSLRKMPDSENRLGLFGTLEGRFKNQARFVTLVTGLSGFFMLAWLNAWDRYLEPSFWWLHLMTFIWLVFTLVLFVLEPLFVRSRLPEKARRDPAKAFRMIHRMLWVLLTLSLLAVLGGVAGVH